MDSDTLSRSYDRAQRSNEIKRKRKITNNHEEQTKFLIWKAEEKSRETVLKRRQPKNKAE